MLKVLSVGEVLTANDTRQYYKTEFKDDSNPFSKPVTRVIFQRTTANGNVWDADPKDITKLIGKHVKGEIVSREVPPYTILGSDGKERTVSSYTTVVFGHENEYSVFKGAGHGRETVEEPETESIGVIEPSNLI